MKATVRIYRRHDADLLQLKAGGISVGRLMNKALAAYAAGTPMKAVPPVIRPRAIESYPAALRFTLTVSDPASIRVLRQIRPGYRCAFLKMLVRSVLAEQTLSCFFNDPAIIRKDDNRFTSADASIPRLSPERKLTKEEIIKDAEEAEEQIFRKRRAKASARPVSGTGNNKDISAIIKDQKKESRTELPDRKANNAVPSEDKSTDKPAASRPETPSSPVTSGTPVANVPVMPPFGEEDDDPFGSLESPEEKQEKRKQATKDALSLFDQMLEEG